MDLEPLIVSNEDWNWFRWYQRQDLGGVVGREAWRLYLQECRILRTDPGPRVGSAGCEAAPSLPSRAISGGGVPGQHG